MNAGPPRVLVVDDERSVRYVLRGLLEPLECHVFEADGGASAIRQLQDAEAPVDLVITDLRMPEVDGMAVLSAAQELDAPPTVVVITAHGSERHAVEALKAGASDYFRKPFEPDELLACVRRSLGLHHTRKERDELQAERLLGETMRFRSPAMKALAAVVARVAPLDITVLITGESGTGKERLAEAIVRGSSRRDAPFVRFNAAALRPELAEAELFGHARGAFTGATDARQGLFRAASGGTLLLDEIGDLPLAVQAKLLRVLQEGEVRPVGKDSPTPVDVRVIAATHHDLAKRVAEGTFRQDLYYRLKVVELHVPPLRERVEDIPLLAEWFAGRFAERFGMRAPHINAAVLGELCAYEWPGNVRELSNTIEGAVALSGGEELAAGLVPASASSSERTSAASLEARVAAYERGVIIEALRLCAGNRSAAARRLRIGRATLYEKIARHSIRRDET
ncbi:MAG: sigma-54 dependent transcriptional regulator [Myxococcota bacterium]